MARITVEDCLEKINSQYDLVMLAKERCTQLNAGGPALVPEDNDKNTVIALREIGEGKVSIKALEDSAINRLRKQQEETSKLEDLDEEHGDNFDKVYKGEVSKSGTAILPSKRIRHAPEKSRLYTKSSDNIKEDKNEELEKQIDTDILATENKSE
ncbi:MAG: DNA-directed RNA polymerase subunit omega [Pelagibacteraceae bacterium]|jgi:DNA-directed RNA polymerase subunit omega|nr:DNA-directed RNA polymerase subunit omega [Candidatus Pelagibacter sp.]MDP6681044.1 DNA-directed RNA polymerase subunit omega [Pelagibacteraceae bacterium]MDP6710538.1 DNA-directed RNA polymerase subunit omega [Pelagibacteraceae bacterium]